MQPPILITVAEPPFQALLKPGLHDEFGPAIVIESGLGTLYLECTDQDMARFEAVASAADLGEAVLLSLAKLHFSTRAFSDRSDHAFTERLNELHVAQIEPRLLHIDRLPGFA